MIYLDNNATTRPTRAVCEASDRAVRELWANPSSVHREGQRVRAAVELARASVAGLIGARARDVTFTSSGTESIHLAIRGVLGPAKRKVLVTTAVEHAAIRDLAASVARHEGVEVRLLPLGPGGVVDVEQAGAMIEGASIVSVQWANNETGAIQPIERLAAMTASAGGVFHCDATQWVGKMPTDVRTLTGVDLLSFSAHKFHGLKGVGMLWAASGIGLRPSVPGSQELGRRGGTENVTGIVASGVAADEAGRWLEEEGERERLEALRDRFEAGVLEGCPCATVNGSGGAPRLWNTSNIGFERLEAEALLLLLSEQGLCASAGAACSSGSLEPSPVLLAMGIRPEVAHGSVRFSLSRETSEAEIDRAVEVVARCVGRLGGV